MTWATSALGSLHFLEARQGWLSSARYDLDPEFLPRFIGRFNFCVGYACRVASVAGKLIFVSYFF